MIARLHYVICDGCGLPASTPVETTARARALVPKGWTRARRENAYPREWRVDYCPDCSTWPLGRPIHAATTAEVRKVTPEDRRGMDR